MTLRRSIITGGLAAALSLGALAIPTTAGAAPAAPASAAAPTFVTTGRDPLAAYADVALNSYLRYIKTGKARDLGQFSTIRDALALEAGRRLGMDGTLLKAAWRKADLRHQVALMAAMTQLGTPYRRNSSQPGVGFDCSGLTSWAWAQSGVSLFHQSRTQINSVPRIDRSTAQAGDLVYYPGHVMLYLGVGDAILHAPYTGRSVEFAYVGGGHTSSTLFGNPVG